MIRFKKILIREYSLEPYIYGFLLLNVIVSVYLYSSNWKKKSHMVS